jgi:hypothetical protein
MRTASGDARRGVPIGPSQIRIRSRMRPPDDWANPAASTRSLSPSLQALSETRPPMGSPTIEPIGDIVGQRP